MADPTSVSVLIASWFTPSSLFIFVNLVIGTIAITSRFSSPKRQIHVAEELGPHNSPQLVRSPSLIERVRSFRLSYYNYESPTAFAEPECAQPQLVRTPSLLERVRSFGLGHYYNYEPPTAFAEPECTQPQLVRTPSLLERVRSFGLGHYYNYESPTAFAEPECTQPQLVRTPSLLERVRSFGVGHYYSYESPTVLPETESTQPQLVRTPSFLERIRSFNFGLHKHKTSHAETDYEQAQAQAQQPESEGPNQDDPKEPQLTRASSLLQRLQSMNFSRLHRSATAHVNEEPEPETEGPDSDPGRDSGEKAAAEMRKSASERARSVKSEWEEDEETVEKRRPTTSRGETTSLVEDEEVDAKADDFINRFKKQLRLQRVDSILRYREMLRAN